MDDQLLRRAAVLQAKVKFLEQQNDSFTDREDILAFQRLRKQFDTVVSRHRNELTADPLVAVKQRFENDRALINKLRQIDAETRLRKVVLSMPPSGLLTSEFLANTIEWLPSQKESLEAQLAILESRLSHDHWDKNSGELLPYAKVIAEVLSEEDLLTPDTEEWVATAFKLPPSVRGAHYEAFLATLAGIAKVINEKVLYVMHAGERLGPLLLDDLEKLLGQRAVFPFDLAWHQAEDEW